ncbi:protoporphyrinogen oxidase HemJ [Futiania mangrovi]|uniref:Protoporphyrinogen IX oxidase n=1 Tax=Futiania mangrovi TaxID=2959716 RepID=A0A9J6PFC5_9PROT|nr:protoporphyrinogen oxidase HemJ [Futiania mangrovii]MCP1336499.1 protoporphyrinogen oxidase HemJ [Futiania mangrovii]
MAEYYLWLKTAHIVSMVAWMAALFYLPRLYVYHVSAEPGGELDDTLKIMERRLLKAIMTPAMMATWVFGLLLLGSGVAGMAEGWLHAKVVLVLLLSGFHGACAKWRKDFEAGRNTRSERFYRVANEVPTVLLIAIVLLAVVKPF